MSITEHLQRMIAASRTPPAELRISDKAAWELAGEMAQQQLTLASSRSAIYDGLKAGTSKFMGLLVVVAEPGPDDPDAG